MQLSSMSVALLGNAPAPSYQVTLPPGREWVYEAAPWVFAALAMAAGGLWVARRQVLGPVPRRGLLWVTAGSIAVAYSAYWLWTNRAAGVVPPDLPASVAVWMHAIWAVGAAVVLIMGWRRPQGGRAALVPTALAGRALGLAVITLVAGGLVGALGFRPAFVVLLPGFWAAWAGPRSEVGSMLAFLGVNTGVWWVAWAFALRAIEGFHADADRAEPHAAADRGLTSE